MSKRIRSLLLKYGITLAVGAMMTCLVLELHGFSMAVSQAEKYRILSDALTIPAFLLLGIGVLVWLSNAGTFLGLGYVMRHMIGGLIPGMRMKKEENYHDYLMRKRAKEKASGYGFLIISGAIFLALSVIVLILFYQVYRR